MRFEDICVGDYVVKEYGYPDKDGIIIGRIREISGYSDTSIQFWVYIDILKKINNTYGNKISLGVKNNGLGKWDSDSRNRLHIFKSEDDVLPWLI